MRKTSVNKNGVGLLEILIVVSTLAGVGLLLNLILIQNNGLFIQQTDKVTRGINLNDLSDSLTLDLRQALRVVANYPLVNPPIVTSESTLVLQLPAIDQSGNILDGIFDHLIYLPDNANPEFLMRVVYPHASSSRSQARLILTKDLKQIKFSYYDKEGNLVSPVQAAKVSFSIIVLGQNPFLQKDLTVSGEVRLRNI